MTTLLALYRGDTIAEAKLVAVTAEPRLVAAFADRLLKQVTPCLDPVLLEVERGRRRALSLIVREAEAPDAR